MGFENKQKLEHHVHLDDIIVKYRCVCVCVC